MRKSTITYEMLLQLRRHPDRLTWDAIAEQLGYTKRTLLRIWKNGKNKEAEVSHSN